MYGASNKKNVTFFFLITRTGYSFACIFYMVSTQRKILKTEINYSRNQKGRELTGEMGTRVAIPSSELAPPTPPSPQASVCPPVHLAPGGGGHTRFRGEEGGGGSQFRRPSRSSGTLYTLWELPYGLELVSNFVQCDITSQKALILSFSSVVALISELVKECLRWGALLLCS